MFDANEPPALPPDFSTAAKTPAKTPAKTSRTVTRYDIATAIMKRVPALSRREATQVFECALQEIAEALSRREESVKLHEFGTFFVRERASRPGRSPFSLDAAPHRQRKFLSFRPSLGLREKVEKAQGHASTRRTVAGTVATGSASVEQAGARSSTPKIQSSAADAGESRLILSCPGAVPSP